MTTLAILLGIKRRPTCEPCMVVERAARLASVEALIAEIAERL